MEAYLLEALDVMERKAERDFPGMPLERYVRRLSFGNGRNDAAAVSVADFADDEI